MHILDPACDSKDIAIGEIYQGKVNGLANFGAFVDLSESVRGLAHNKYLKSRPEVGDTLFVAVRNILPNGNIELEPVEPKEYNTVEVEKELPLYKAAELTKMVGKQIMIKGEVIQVKQTGGPTIFTVADDSGLVFCAAFERAGIRAYAEIDSEMMVRIIGEVSLRNNQVQVEIKSMKRLWGGEASTVKDGIEQAIDRRAEPSETEFLIKSEIMTRLLPAMKQVAKEIRRAIFKSQPIVVRHHADADGITAAVAIEMAILPLITEVGGPDAEYHSYRRAPSKAPFYELEDVTKDLTYALEDQTRHGQKMPLIVLMDNGSTEEDVPAMRQAQVYGLEMLVVDHHHPHKIVDQFLIAHVNPAHQGGDFGLTTGMLATEIARMIYPEVEEKIRHFPAVSAVGDRSEAPEAALYIKLVEDKYGREDLKKIALALDYEAFWQRFNDGRGLINDILCLGRLDRHRRIVELLCEQANAAIDEQLRASMGNVKIHKAAQRHHHECAGCGELRPQVHLPPAGQDQRRGARSAVQEVCRKAGGDHRLRPGLCGAAQPCGEDEHPPDGQGADGGDSQRRRLGRRAPGGGLDQVRGRHEKGCAGQAGGEDRRLRGGRGGGGEGRGGDGVRAQASFLYPRIDLAAVF